MYATVTDAEAALYAASLFALLVFLPATVTTLKGHWGLLLAGFFFLGLVWIIAALRLARPQSWWARRFYGEEKRARARARYGGPRS